MKGDALWCRTVCLFASPVCFKAGAEIFADDDLEHFDDRCPIIGSRIRRYGSGARGRDFIGLIKFENPSLICASPKAVTSIYIYIDECEVQDSTCGQGIFPRDVFYAFFWRTTGVVGPVLVRKRY